MQGNLKYAQKIYHQILVKLLKVIKIPIHTDFQNILQLLYFYLLLHLHHLLLIMIQFKVLVFFLPRLLDPLN